MGGKLDLTRGVETVDGTGGGGLSTFALITGDETRDGVGGEASLTALRTQTFGLTAYSAGLGLFDRLELSAGQAVFDTRDAGQRLGLGRGFTFHETTLSAKLRLIGDAVYDQDRWLPQVAIGAQYKSVDRGALVRALGARRSDDVDYYLAMTKILLDQRLVLNATWRETRANQFGLLGFGGDRQGGLTPQFEGAAALLVNRALMVGAEYRTKPDNLSFARETAAFDVFTVWAVRPDLSLTLAYVALGDVATFRRQGGLYLSAQAGF